MVIQGTQIPEKDSKEKKKKKTKTNDSCLLIKRSYLKAPKLIL